MKKQLKTTILLILSFFSLLLIISCDDDNDDKRTEVSQDNICPLPDLSTIPEEHLLKMENLTTRVRVKSPVFITWGPEKRILQIYRKGVIINQETEHTPQCPGVEIILDNDLYEFKLWKPNADRAEISTWVNVVDKIDYIDHGTQFDADKWLTVPGDACKPIIANYQTAYSKYVELDNTNMLYSQLVCHTDDFKNDIRVNGEQKIHNITYLEKSYVNILEGVHTASYSFQIPSLDTGRTVEGGLFIWVGGETRLDYGTAFQLIVEKGDKDYEKLYYWTGSGPGNEWKYSGKKVKLYNDFFYKVTYTVNCNRRDANIIFEGKDEFYVFTDIFSETTKDKTWSDITVARLQAECISKDGMKYKVNFKNYIWSHNLWYQEDKRALNEKCASSSLGIRKKGAHEIKTGRNDSYNQIDSGDENKYSRNLSKFTCVNPDWKNAKMDDELNINNDETNGFEGNFFSWKAFILSHRKFLVKFEKTSDKFDDTKYLGAKDPMGTLKGGETYSVIYTSMGFTCTGFNQATDSIGTWVYSNADPSKMKISLWGRVYDFTESGNVVDMEYGHVGYLYIAE
jgi:hypothetical protein